MSVCGCWLGSRKSLEEWFACCEVLGGPRSRLLVIRVLQYTSKLRPNGKSFQRGLEELCTKAMIRAVFVVECVAILRSSYVWVDEWQLRPKRGRRAQLNNMVLIAYLPALKRCPGCNFSLHVACRIVGPRWSTRKYELAWSALGRCRPLNARTLTAMLST
jgi:hypothetical protein